MTITLPPDLQELVEEKVKRGGYGSPEEVVRAALDHFLRQADDDFAPGELNALLAEGTADLERGNTYPGEAVFEEIRQLSEARRRGKSA